MKKIILMLVVFILLFTIVGFFYAKENKVGNDQVEIEEIEKVVKQFLSDYFQGFETLQPNNGESNLTENNVNTYAFEMFKRKNIELYKAFDMKYAWFKLRPNFKEISVSNKQAQVEMSLDMSYQLTDVDAESGLYNNFYFDLKKKKDIWQIVHIDLDSDAFENYKEELRKESKRDSFDKITKEDIDAFHIKALKDIKKLKQQIEEERETQDEKMNETLKKTIMESYEMRHKENEILKVKEYGEGYFALIHHKGEGGGIILYYLEKKADSSFEVKGSSMGQQAISMGFGVNKLLFGNDTILFCNLNDSTWIPENDTRKETNYTKMVFELENGQKVTEDVKNDKGYIVILNEKTNVKDVELFNGENKVVNSYKDIGSKLKEATFFEKP